MFEVVVFRCDVFVEDVVDAEGSEDGDFGSGVVVVHGETNVGEIVLEIYSDVAEDVFLVVDAVTDFYQ